MPKLKTHKGAAKRFSKTKNRKVKRGRAGRRHLLSVKSSKRRRNLRKPGVCAKSDGKKILELIGAS